MESEPLEYASAGRLADCEKAIELSHIVLVNSAVAGGWTEREVAAALFNLAQAHLNLLESSAHCAGIVRSDVGNSALPL